MNASRTLVTAILFATLLAGCGAGFHVQSAVPLVQTLDAPAAAVYDAIVASVREQGWTTEVADPSQGWIEAVTPVDSSGGVSTRERWEFHVRGAQVSVTMLLEMREHGAWTSTSLVCKTYSYAQERAQLARIEARAQQSATSLAAR